MAERKLKLGRVLRIAAALMLLALMVYGAIQLSRPLPPPPLPLPNPNGYDDFIKATKYIVGDPLKVNTEKTEELVAFVAQNREAIRLTRTGLSRRCYVPNGYYGSPAVFSPQRLMDLKRLCWVLAAEGKLAEMEAHIDDVIQTYLETIRYGEEIGRGGLMIDKLVGVACEHVGILALHRNLSRLSLSQCREIIHALEEIDQRREPIETVWPREAAFERAMITNWKERLSLWKAKLTGFFGENRTKKQRLLFTRHLKAYEAKTRLLFTEAAVRSYHLENATLPKDLGELVPQYLKALPQDPFFTKGMIYRVRSEGFLLYSVGPDGVDDDGKPLKESIGSDIPTGDLFIDSPSFITFGSFL